MLRVEQIYTEKSFLTEFSQWYDSTRYYNDKNLEGLSTYYYYLKINQNNKNKTLTHDQVIDEVKRLTVVESVRLYTDLTGENYYGDGDVGLIAELSHMLKDSGLTYISYIQVGVRKERLVVFLDKE